MIYHVNFSKKAQLKIQQMAFVLVALVIFMAIAAIFYLSVSLTGLKQTAGSLEQQRAKELVRKISSTPELAFTAFDCTNCVDLDKVFLLKERKSYDQFWKLDFLQIEKVYPLEKEECSRINYPNCRTITLIKKEEIGSPSTAYVSLCYWARDKEGYYKCDLGRIYASGKDLK